MKKKKFFQKKNFCIQMTVKFSVQGGTLKKFKIFRIFFILEKFQGKANFFETSTLCLRCNRTVRIGKSCQIASRTLRTRDNRLLVPNFQIFRKANYERLRALNVNLTALNDVKGAILPQSSFSKKSLLKFFQYWKKVWIILKKSKIFKKNFEKNFEKK